MFLAHPANPQIRKIRSCYLAPSAYYLGGAMGYLFHRLGRSKSSYVLVIG